MRARLGQKMIVENLDGADGGLGTARVAGSKPGGRTSRVSARLPSSGSSSSYDCLALQYYTRVRCHVVAGGPLINR